MPVVYETLPAFNEEPWLVTPDELSVRAGHKLHHLIARRAAEVRGPTVEGKYYVRQNPPSEPQLPVIRPPDPLFRDRAADRARAQDEQRRDDHIRAIVREEILLARAAGNL